MYKKCELGHCSPSFSFPNMDSHISECTVSVKRDVEQCLFQCAFSGQRLVMLKLSSFFYHV